MKTWVRGLAKLLMTVLLIAGQLPLHAQGDDRRQQAIEAAKRELADALRDSGGGWYEDQGDGPILPGLYRFTRLSPAGGCLISETLTWPGGTDSRGNFIAGETRDFVADWSKRSGFTLQGSEIHFTNEVGRSRFLRFSSPGEAARAHGAATRLAALCNGKDEAEEGELKTAIVHWRGAKYDFGERGYDQASVELKYKFIACFGEIHLAYSLVSDSVKVGANYAVGRRSDDLSVGRSMLVPSSDAALPQPPSIGFRGKVSRNFQTIAFTGDAFAGPALGFGCFSGQLQKIGTVEQLVGPKASPAAVKEYLDSLALIETVVAPYEPLRNATLEQGDAERAKARIKEALQANQANFDRLKAETEASIEARRAAQRQYEAGVRQAEEARQKFEQDQAAYEKELARAREAEAAHRKQLEAWKNATKKP